MVDSREAVENVKNLARVFQSVIDLAAQLEGAQSVEQAVRATNAQLVQMRKEVKVVQAQRDQAAAEATTLLENARVQADQIVADAKGVADKADTLQQAAHADAQRIVALAKTEADAWTKAAREAAEAANKQAEAARHELADMEAKIERARAKMRDILGA